MPHIHLARALSGAILDIGGGGEGVVGRLYGRGVTAIDNRQEELDEAPDCCEKRLMDATALEFEDDSFDAATCFYSLMYMSRETKRRALAEAARVLRPGGRLYIWDAAFSDAWPEPFVVHLDIEADNFSLSVDYGVAGEDLAQDAGLLVALATEAGLASIEQTISEGQLYLMLRKARPCSKIEAYHGKL